MLFVRNHPDWSDAKIAGEVGIHKSQLSRCREYQYAAGLARGSKNDLPSGHITIDDEEKQGVEAVARDQAPLDGKADRGQQIPRSKYFREYCSECEEPMKVRKDQVGSKPVCDDCQS